MTTQLPLLSVITSIYNGGDDILRFLDAINNQTYKNLELIILDDCSTDEKTLEIVKALKNNQIKINVPYHFIQNKENLGTVYSFQEGLKYAKGEYFTFPQTDDYMDDDFYEVLMNELLKKNYDVIDGLLFCEYEKDNVQNKKEEDLNKTIVGLLENIKLPLEIKNHHGQILSFFMPDITYCWFHVFSKQFLLDNSFSLNFLNAVKYGISKTLYNEKYNVGTVPLFMSSFYYHKSHVPFEEGGIYNISGNKEYNKALFIERFILNEVLKTYNNILGLE